MNLFRSLLLLILSHEVAANTEIISFSPSFDLALHLAGNWSELTCSDNERQWMLEPSEPLWVVLDLDDPACAHPSFTLRLSWPASVPAEVELALFTPRELAQLSGYEAQDRYTRARYARVRAVSAPHASPSGVPIHLVLEPAYMGFLPASLVPTFAWLVPVVLVATWVARWVSTLLEPYARQARLDSNTGKRT